MSTKLDIWQTNMLITGNTLGAEVPAPSPNHRAFLYVRGYSVRGRPSIFLNGDHSDVRFRIRVMEIAEEYIGSPYDTSSYMRGLARHEGIGSISELEEVLHSYLDDFSLLVSSAKVAY